VSLHPAFLFPPIGLLCYDRTCLQQAPATTSSEAISKDSPPSSSVATDRTRWPPVLPFALRYTAIYTLFVGLFIGLSRLLLPSWAFLPSVYLTPLTLPDLTPNTGLWWYFFIEMFDAFRSFFLGVFWLHMLSYSVPFCLRLSKQPLAAVVLMMGACAVLQPYANIGDVGAWLSALGLLGHVFECKHFNLDIYIDCGRRRTQS
jgi:phosphatidylinositol glycan class U